MYLSKEMRNGLVCSVPFLFGAKKQEASFN
jgi:hypothetical protein